MAWQKVVGGLRTAAGAVWRRGRDRVPRVVGGIFFGLTAMYYASAFFPPQVTLAVGLLVGGTVALAGRLPGPSH